jgi:hypothetical protein
VNKKLFIGLFLAGMTTLSACVTAANYQPPENPSQYAGKTRFYGDKYVNCLADNGALHLQRGYKGAPSKSTIKAACVQEEEDLYKAAYVDSWGSQDVSPNWRKSTAENLIRQADETFMGR